jgi:hypothetical protein
MGTLIVLAPRRSELSDLIVVILLSSDTFALLYLLSMRLAFRCDSALWCAYFEQRCLSPVRALIAADAHHCAFSSARVIEYWMCQRSDDAA